MAAYNFPNSPSDGDTVTSNGITYTYSSSKTRWDGAAASGSSTTVYATIDLLPLSGASTGDQAYVSGNNRLYIWNGTGWYNIALINTTPSISGASSAYTLATDGTATTVTITATDPEGIPITYSIASDTSGNVATVTQGTGSNSNVFTITPSTNSANGGTFSLTFRASDGVNIATAVSSFTLIFGIENSRFTSALVTSVGANNAVNNSFDDASTNNHTITANGNVTQNTFSPYRHGGYSTYFDGSGDSLYTPTHSSLTASGDFTVEMWIYPEQIANPSGQSPTFFAWSGTSFMLYITSSTGILNLYSGAIILSSDSAIQTNRWTHVAVARDSGTTRLFVNGVSEDSITSFSTNPSGRVVIGSEDPSGYAYGSGYISDVRVVNGTAVYTSAFTPPDERLSAITNTSLLTCHLPYIADGSTNNHSITVNGNTKTEPFSPYDHNGYSASSYGGSMYFDGNDSLSLPQTSLDLGSDDFCVEAWAYTTSTSNQCIVGSYRYADGVGAWNLNINYNSKKIRFFIRHSGGSVIDGLFESGTFPTNQWVHVAVTRDGSNLRAFINGTQAGSTNTSIGSNTIDNAQTNYYVGVATDSQIYWQGYISDVRVVKGSSVYTSAFTPPTAPLTAITNTSLLLNGTDAGIIDKSQSVKTITLNGDTKSSTTQAKYLTTSMYFDGTGDYLQMDDQNVGNFGTLDFTAEGWIYLLDNSALYTVVDGRPSTLTSASGWSVAVSTAGALYIYSGGFLITGASSAVTANNWHHWAYTRENGTHKLFLNGTQTGSSSTASRDFTAQLFRIGASGTGGEVFKGYQSDVRITKGLARYTSNFTVPSAALQG